MLNDFLGWMFSQRPQAARGRPGATALLPAPGAACWRRIVMGEAELPTANLPLQFLLKNNVRYVRRAGDAESTIAERIRITHSFFLKNHPLLGPEIQRLFQVEAGSRR